MCFIIYIFFFLIFTIAFYASTQHNPSSVFRLRTSLFRLPTSDFPLPTSLFRPQSSLFHHHSFSITKYFRCAAPLSRWLPFWLQRVSVRCTFFFGHSCFDSAQHDPTSVFGLRSSVFGLPSSVFRLPSSSLIPQRLHRISLRSAPANPAYR
jgi:hypothetical protein